MADSNQYRETLKNYVRKGLSGGVPLSQIKQSMLEKGYPEPVVESVLKEVNNGNKPKIALYIAGVVGVAIIIVSIYILIAENPSKTPSKLLSQAAEEELNACKAGTYNRCMAIANKDISFCEKIEKTNISNDLKVEQKDVNISLKDNCKEIVPLLIYYAESIKQDKCQSIPSYFSLAKEEIMNDCMEILNALEKDDRNLCTKETCNFAYTISKASSEKSIETCNEINDATAKSDCKMLVSSSPDYCDYSGCETSRDKFIADSIRK